MPSVRAIALALVVSLTVPVVIAQDPDQPAAVCQAGLRTMEGVGLVCPQPDGLFEVFSNDLVSLGFIHGTDPAPLGEAAFGSDEPIEVMTGTTPSCVAGTAGTYYTQVIYARATDDTDQYASLVATIRTLVGNANKLVDDAAIATGGHADIRVKCVSGVIEVKNEVLPTAKASASFSTIVTDLRNKGYNDGKVKYWVYYDDTSACTCGGTGHVYNDDTLAATNLNNGNGVSMFAVDFGYNDVRVWMHEHGHTMGAVQNSAPRSTGAGHCIDGRDTMCYNDGGPNGGSYSTTSCATEVFDCGKNDYFHLNPAAGSYLATKWNLGSSLNRFLTFSGAAPIAPTMTSLSCTPTTVAIGASTTCTFAASDSDSSGVRYTVNWGDASSTLVPTSGYVTPGTSQSSSHSYSTSGSKTVTVSVVDNGGTAGTNTLSATINVLAASPPVMQTLTCTPTTVETGQTVTCSFSATDADSSGVRYTVNWGDATSTLVPTSGYVAPGSTRSATHTYSTTGAKTVTVSVVDNGGTAGSNTKTATVNVVFDKTPPVITLQDPVPGRLYNNGCAPIEAPVLRPTFVGAGCMRATVTDAKSAVTRVDVYLDGSLVGSDTTAPYMVAFPVSGGPETNVPMRVEAFDAVGNKATATVFVDYV